MAEDRRVRHDRRALAAYLDLVQASESLDSMLGRPLVSAGLTLTQFRVLEMILREGPRERHELSRRLFRTESNATAVLKVLIRRGLVAYGRHETDKRKSMVHLTAQGHALIAKIYPRQARLARAQMAVLNGREQITLSKLCQKLIEGDPMKFMSELTLVDVSEE